MLNPTIRSGHPVDAVRLGTGDTREAYRCLVSSDAIRIGSPIGCGIQVGALAGADCDVLRDPPGFAVRPRAGAQSTYLTSDPLVHTELATGDVIHLGSVWVEVRVLDAPFEEEVE